MDFVQTGYDLDENFIADLIIRDQNKSDQDLNVNEMNFVQPNFDLDEDFITDLIRGDQNKSDQDLNANRFSLISVEGRIKAPSRLHQHNKKQTVKKGKHIPSINNDTIEVDIPIVNLVYDQNTKQLVTDMSNNLKSSVIWRPWL